MSLSTSAVKALNVATGSKQDGVGDEIAAAIDSNGSGPAANVSAMGSTTNLSAIAASYADLAAARTSVNTLKGETEARLDAIEAKVDEVIAALIAAGMMSS
jgi:hypothetical protein